MFNIEVQRTLNGSADDIFQLLTEHENYHQFKAVESSHLIKEGLQEKNGLGAQRVIKNGAFEVTETVVAFKRPELFGYKISKAKPFKMEHLHGQIELKSLNAEQTQVTWRSQGRVLLPLIGRLLDKKMQRDGAIVFASILKQISYQLTK